jgi:uncharacterized protein (TIGR04222 family)
MNPFDLPGPQFLAFYAVLAVASGVFLWINRHHKEDKKNVSAPELTDPYLVAYLRAGEGEVWRLATIRLVDRALLQADGATITTAPDAKPEDAQNEVERATLEWFRKPQDAISIVQESGSPRLRRLTSPYEKRLVELGLMPDKAARQRHRARFGAVACILAAVAGIKILMALDRGNKNVVLLILLAGFALIALYHIEIPVRTVRGRAVIEDLKKLFSRLHQPGLLQPGKSSAEVMWMAAVYGWGALAFSHVERLYPKAQRGAQPGGSGGGCGSSCGSSCGGGGCGGGCGGCGG